MMSQELGKQLKKYLIIFTSAFLLELVTTAYIWNVAEKKPLEAMIFAFISPFMSLPFVLYVIDEKSLPERLKMACCSGSGYAVGVCIIMYLFG